MKKAIKSFLNFVERNVFPLTIPYALGAITILIFAGIVKLMKHFGLPLEGLFTLAAYCVVMLIGLPIYNWLLNKLFQQR